MIRPALAAAILATMLAPPAWAGVLVPIAPVPRSVSMLVVGINDSNVVTGSYTTADGQRHGFVGTIDAFQGMDARKSLFDPANLQNRFAH